MAWLLISVVRVRLLGLQRDRRALYRYLIGDLADFEFGVDAVNRVRRDVQLLGHESPEARGADRYVIGARQAR